MRSRHFTVGRLPTTVAGARNAEFNPQSAGSSHSHALVSPPAPSQVCYLVAGAGAAAAVRRCKCHNSQIT